MFKAIERVRTQGKEFMPSLARSIGYMLCEHPEQIDEWRQQLASLKLEDPEIMYVIQMQLETIAAYQRSHLHRLELEYLYFTGRDENE